MMKNLTSKLIGVGLLNIVLATGLTGCATDYDKIRRQEMMQKYNMREASFSEDGFTAYISPFGFRHNDE
jgi:hypothetical protein